jgi:hypothetical protein
VVVGTERIGRVVGVLALNGLGGVTFVKDDASLGELRVLGDALLETIKDLLLGGQVVHLKAGSGGDSDGAVLADRILFSGALNISHLRVGDIAEFIVDSPDGIEWSQELFGFFGGATVAEGPRDDWLFLGDRRVDVEITEVDRHVDGSRTIVLKGIESTEDSTELVTTPDIVVIVPRVWAAGEDVQLEACYNPKVVARTLHAPQEIAIASFIDPNESAVAQNNVELADIVADHAVKTFMASVATSKGGTHHTDAIAGTGGGNMALVPKVPGDLTIVYTTSEPGRLAAGLDSNIPEIDHVDLNAIERSHTFRGPVATVVGQELNAVFIAVFNLDYCQLKRVQ